jgi:beta-xylosidase
MIKIFLSCVALLSCLFFSNNVHAQKATNPIIFADVPDISMMRVGDTYYMSSTTMHMSPGVPIMKSKDLVNWQLVSYAYGTLANMVPRKRNGIILNCVFIPEPMQTSLYTKMKTMAIIMKKDFIQPSAFIGMTRKEN